MEKYILDHYCRFTTFTNPGCYKELLQDLPDDIKELGNLISHQVIHRKILKAGNKNANKDLIYGDMEKYPWYRLRCDDDVLPTAVSIVAELIRLDGSGLKTNRKVENKIVVTCRYVAILMAAILKSKEMPCRVRSGFSPYLFKGSWDHWINQYWDSNNKKWITFDADGFLNNLGFDQYDIPKNKFDWAADTWLGIRNGSLEANDFINAGGFRGPMPVLWAVFYDFHCLMNNEIMYLQKPRYITNRFEKLKEKELKEIDNLAELMQFPDENFHKLVQVWNTQKKFRILNSPLIGDESHVRWR
jgi:hypothetical protein